MIFPVAIAALALSAAAAPASTMSARTRGAAAPTLRNRLQKFAPSQLRETRGQRPVSMKAEDFSGARKDLEKKFVEKRAEFLEETQDDRAAANPIGTVGGTAPMGKFWDPAGFTREADPNQVRRYRESEVTHGRLAMLGTLGFLTQENFAPLFGGHIEGPAINHFQEIQSIAPNFWYPVFLAITIAELGRARYGWEEPTKSLFGLRPEYEPGNLAFDPLNLAPKDEARLESMKNKELNNGRLAMLALAGMIAQELVTQKPLLA